MGKLVEYCYWIGLGQQSLSTVLVMKTKVFPVESVNSDHLFDPQLVKYEFRRKIDYRLSVMQNQRKVMRRRRDNFTTVRACSSKEENVTAAELLFYVDVAMKLQQNASEAAIATNRAYAIQLLLVFSEAFISFLFNCYHLISLLAEPSAFKLPLSQSVDFLLEHMIEPCLCVAVTVLGFALVQCNFKNTQSIVNKIIIHAQDNDIRSRFLAFSQQIQSNIPNFTIYGLFPLDGSVVFSMISATTTYLIILVQTLGSRSEIDSSLFSSHQTNKVNKSL